MEFEYILYITDGHVAKIVFNRPEAFNALSKKMITEIGQALDEAEKNDEIRVVIITGSGKAFCTGTDLKFARKELSTPWASQEFFRFINKSLVTRIEELNKPVIAAVNGLALAGGFEIMLASDLAVASEEALIGDQHINVGLVAGAGGTQRLMRLIGGRKAKELLFTGKRVTGKEAERIGLVNYAVPADQLEATVKELAREISEKSPIALRITKALTNKALQVDSSLATELEIMSSALNTSSEDYREGMQAFNEKRKPVFKGR